MSPPIGDRVVVSVSEAGNGWTVEIDLEGGTATRRSRAVGAAPRPVSADTLAALRAHARRAFDGGDYEHREQFADGEMSVAITLAGRTVTLSYITAGVSRYERVEALYAFACSCP